MTTADPEAVYRLLELARNKVANDDEATGVLQQIKQTARDALTAAWEPYPWQHPHTHPPGWVSERNGQPYEKGGVCDDRCYELPTTGIRAQGMWLELGGRGTGKTEGAAHYVNRHAQGPACDTRLPGGHKMLIVAPTQGDAVDACVTGISGLQTINPGVTLTTSKGGTWARWPNGSRARILGASTPEDVERLRAAGNNCLVWLEELAAMRRLKEALHHARLGLRVGERAHFVGSTTPKRRPEVKELLTDPLVVRTKGRTRDATRLPEDTRAFYEERFAGTPLGRQELDADELGDIEGALWVADRPTHVDGKLNDDDRPGIEQDRVPYDSVGGWAAHDVVVSRFGVPFPPPPPVAPTIRVGRIAVGVDPSGGSTATGISVVGSAGNHGYVLADFTTDAGPDGWGKIAVLAYLDYGAEGIAMERTYGGNQTEFVVQAAADALGVPMPPLLPAPTQEGKGGRALPIVALSNQHRFHLVGYLPELEDEMTGWVEGETKESPNRLDAMVHAARHLLVRARTGTMQVPGGDTGPLGGGGVRFDITN